MMTLQEYRNRSKREIKEAYKVYLQENHLSENTIKVSSCYAFYIWNKKGADAFWDAILSSVKRRLHHISDFFRIREMKVSDLFVYEI